MRKVLIFLLSASLSLQAGAEEPPVVPLPRTFSAPSLNRQSYDEWNTKFADSEKTVLGSFEYAYSLGSISQQLNASGLYPAELVASVEPCLVAFLVLVRQGFIEAAKVQMRKCLLKLDAWHDNEVRKGQFSDQEATRLLANFVRVTIVLTLQRFGNLKSHETDRLNLALNQLIEVTQDSSQMSAIEAQTNQVRLANNGPVGISSMLSGFLSFTPTFAIGIHRLGEEMNGPSLLQGFLILGAVLVLSSASFAIAAAAIWLPAKAWTKRTSRHPDWPKISQSCASLLSSNRGIGRANQEEYDKK